jgi:hypothetical protein
MRGGFKTVLPAVGAPLPAAVRRMMHDLMRAGHTVARVDQNGSRWRVQYLDGSQLRQVAVRSSEADAA